MFLGELRPGRVRVDVPFPLSAGAASPTGHSLLPPEPHAHDILRVHSSLGFIRRELFAKQGSIPVGCVLTDKFEQVSGHDHRCH